MDTGFNYLPRRRPVRVRPRPLELRGRAPASARARRPPRGGRSSGRSTPSSSRRSSVEPEHGRVLLRLRRQVPARVDARRSSASRAGRLPDATSRSAARTSAATSARARVLGRRALQRLPAGDLGGADQPQRHAPLARDRAASSTCRPFELAAARRGDRLEPVRGDRALVRAGQRAARRPRRRRGDRRRTASCSPIRRRRRSWAARARERVLDEHTYAHRARRLLELLGLGVPVAAGV